MYQQVVALGELSVTKPAYELFFGPGRPADTCSRTNSGGPRPGAHRRPIRGWSGARGRPAEQRRRRLATVLTTRVQQERVRVAALMHDRLPYFVLVQRHGHQLVLLLLVEQRNGRSRSRRSGVRRRRRRRRRRGRRGLLLRFVLGHVHARRRLLLLLLLKRLQVVVLVEGLVLVGHHGGGEEVGGRRRRERRDRRVPVERSAGRHDRHERRAHARLYALPAYRSRLSATASARHYANSLKKNTPEVIRYLYQAILFTFKIYSLSAKQIRNKRNSY